MGWHRGRVRPRCNLRALAQVRTVAGWETSEHRAGQRRNWLRVYLVGKLDVATNTEFAPLVPTKRRTCLNMGGR